jgi:hypothetical protein
MSKDSENSHKVFWRWVLNIGTTKKEYGIAISEKLSPIAAIA